jgi:hypothetical protein
MKAARNLILGTAAGLMAVSAAQAADLPVKAKPVDYVKICSPFGAGFFFIPAIPASSSAAICVPTSPSTAAARTASRRGMAMPGSGTAISMISSLGRAWC